jgi:regulator of protease activity HflC (stomatin/prohibitin superfamily)
VPPQEVITRDNVTIRVTAVLYFYVVDPIAAVVNVVNFNQATTQIGQTTLRNVLSQSELDELLAERKKINRDLQAIIDEQTERWGVKSRSRMWSCLRRCSEPWPNRRRRSRRSGRK